MTVKKLLLKANALQYTLIIGVVIFLLLLSLILYFNLNKLYSLRTDALVNQIQNNTNAFFYPVEYPQFLVSRKDWGAYQVTTIKNDKSLIDTEKNKIEISKSALTSIKWDNLDLPQLYLENDLSGLQISGKTFIEGKVYVPKSKVLTASVGSKIYEGPALNSLNIEPSISQLPIHPKREKYFKEWQDFYQDSIVEYKSDLDLYNSFNDKGVSVISDITIHIRDGSFNGQVKILSSKKIVVYESAQLNDVMLIAPVIIFKENFKGSVHAVAQDSIYVSNDTKLSYPSSLTITNRDSTGESPLITLSENSNVEGVINQFYYDYEKSNFPQLLISSKAIVKGVIYNSGSTVLNGTIDGSLFTKSLLAYQKGSIYRNFIIDGRLKKAKWQSLIADNDNIDNEESRPIKWLY